VKTFLGAAACHFYPRVQLPERKKIAVEVSQSLAEHKTEMVIVENTVEAAEHAAKIGLLLTEAIPAIEQEAQEDKGEQPGKEEATVTK
jgi:hypothetical protein